MAEVMWLACGEHEPPESNVWLSDRDRVRIGSMRYTKRHDEARLSRWTAQRAVALATGMSDSIDGIGRVEVGNHPGGAPYARGPSGEPVSISSTDRAGWAVTIVHPGSTAVGCDLELVEARSEAFVRDYFTPAERDMLYSLDAAMDLGANLVWSAKESALKVLTTGLRRDTRTVEVELQPSDEGWSPLTVMVDGVRRFPGWWNKFGSFLLSVVAEADIPPPRSLIEPSPLLSAVPVHSWLRSPLRRP